MQTTLKKLLLLLKRQEERLKFLDVHKWGKIENEFLKWDTEHSFSQFVRKNLYKLLVLSMIKQLHSPVSLLIMTTKHPGRKPVFHLSEGSGR